MSMMAKYYDQVYKDKDYDKEAAYVHSLIGDAKSVLDLGCGTGRHSAYFLKKGIAAQGIDGNPEMIKQARKRGVPCAVDYVCLYRPYRKFDAVVSLFHVASCMTTYADLRAMFRTARSSLRTGGIFVFDFWYGPSVLHDHPAKKAILVEDGVHRFTIPNMRPNENMVDVEHLWVISGEEVKVAEVHEIRYWFLPEIKECLATSGLEFVKAEKWMGGELGLDSWYGLVVARKL